MKLKKKHLTQESTVDPESRLMKESRGFNVDFNVQVTVESKNKIILDFEVSNEVNDRNLLGKMALSAKEILGVDKLDIYADKGYFNISQIHECTQNGITPYVAEENREKQQKQHHPEFRRENFVFDNNHNCYVCPLGYTLKLSGKSKRNGKTLHNYRCSDYGKSPGCSNCLTNCNKFRELQRFDPELEITLAAHRQRMKENPDAMKFRRNQVEHPFGTVKRPMNMGYFLLKGIPKTTGEASLIFLSYNFKRAVNILGIKNLLELLRTHRNGTSPSPAPDSPFFKNEGTLVAKNPPTSSFAPPEPDLTNKKTSSTPLNPTLSAPQTNSNQSSSQTNSTSLFSRLNSASQFSQMNSTLQFSQMKSTLQFFRNLPTFHLFPQRKSPLLTLLTAS